jgi:hypothetical protein
VIFYTSRISTKRAVSLPFAFLLLYPPNHAMVLSPSFDLPLALSSIVLPIVSFSHPNPCSSLSHFSQSHGYPCRLSFFPRARDANAVCRTRAFAFSSWVTEHSIEPGRTSGRPSFPPPFLRSLSAFSIPFLSFDRLVDSPVAAPTVDATDIPRSTHPPRRPTRIGNQFRKTVINGRQRTVYAPGVRGPHRTACGESCGFRIVSSCKPTIRRGVMRFRFSPGNFPRHAAIVRLRRKRS